MIDGVLDGSAATPGAPADLQRGIILLHRPPPVGEGSPAVRLTNAAIDDLVLHDAVLPVGYATNRARPRLPHVRFLVESGPLQDETYPLAPYLLRAGNADVVAPEITRRTCGCT